VEIRYVQGDATRPEAPPGASGPRIVVHVCNDVGGWGAGFVLALSKRWPTAEQRYRWWSRGERAAHDGEADPARFALGEVQLVEVEPGPSPVVVANLVGQRGLAKASDGTPPVRYDAIRAGLATVAAYAERHPGATVHMPRIGCGLAGGRWEEVGPIVQRALCDRGVPVTVYDLPAQPRAK
jgi:O-acetyl-ADP-ribose deacetylase (regulator of RNase III)